MSASPARPDEATLRRFLTGTLDPEGMGLVADYLDEHPEALSTLNALAADDTLVSALRGGAGEGADPSELRQLIDRLRRQPAPRADATEELAGAGRRGADTEAAAEEDDPAEAMRQLLSPAEGSDELGRLAGYRVLRLLGHGGMGLVFEAEDVHLRRRVALKAMQPRLARSATARARFLREARAMAAVTHDHIMPVYQVGEDRGVPYLAMPLLEGSPLEALLAGGPLPVAQVLRLGRQVALGLAAAHGRGLIHRDVKPGNIWVEKASERVKLLDFGLARPMGEEQGLTRSGTVVGTPAYMAPEQARGLAIDGRADLFGLGCVLYRMTTGHPAFAGSDTFAILTSLAVDTPPAPATLNPAVPAALSTLIMRLLEKDPARRSASADAVATELERIAPPAVATPAVPTSVATPSPDETTSLPAAPVPVRRRPRAALLVAAAVLLLAGGGLLLAPLILRLTTPNGELVVTVDDPNLEVVVKQDGAVVRDRTKARSFVLTAARDGQIEFFDPETGVRVLTKTFTIERGRKTVVEATVRERAAAKTPEQRPSPGPLDGLRRQAIPAEELALAGGGDPAKAPAELVAVLGTGRLRHWHKVEGLAFTPDGKYLLSGSGGESVRLWNARTGELITAVPASKAAVYSVVPQGDSRPRLTVRLYNQGKPVGREAGAVRTVSLRPTEVVSPDGKLLAGGPNNANEVTLWDLTTGHRERMVQKMQHHLTSVAFSPDGARLAVAWQCSDGSAPHSIDLYDVAARRLLRTLTLKGKGWPRQVGFTPDGGTLVACDQDGFVRLWDPASGDERRVFPRQNGILEGLALSGDGKLLATAQLGSLVHLWDLTTGQILRTIDSGLHGNHALAFSPDRSTLAAGSPGGAIRLWDVASGTEKRRQGDGGFPVTIALASDGRTLAVADSEGTVGLRDLATGRGRTIGAESPIRQPRIEDLRPLAFSADGTALATDGPDNTLRLWDVATGEERARWRHPNAVGGVAFRPDGRAVATVTRFGDRGYLTLWDVGRGESRQVWHEDGQSTDSVAFSPDGKTLAVRGASGEKGWVGLFDPETGKPGRRFPEPFSPAGGPPVFSPDGRLLAAPAGMQTAFSVVIRETATGTDRFALKLSPVPTAMGSKSWTWAVAFSPDGKCLASAGFDAKVRLWDLTTPDDRARLVRTIPLGPDGGWVRQVFFTPDGRHLLTLNGNGTVYVLRLDQTEAPVLPTKSPASPDRRAAEWVLSVGGTVRVVVGPNLNPYITDVKELPARPFVVNEVMLVRNPKVTADGLATLRRLPALAHVRMEGMPLGDAELAQLDGLRLSELILPGTGITDARLRRLQSVQVVTSLDLGQNPITDAGVAALREIKGLGGLQHLKLYQTRLTDAGLETLKTFQELLELQIGGTAVTAGGVKKLAAALPRCRIEWAGGVIEAEPTPLPAALSPEALVGRPTKLPGVTSWTLETVRHRGAVTAVAFSPNGEWLASGGYDGAVRVWNTRTAELHRLLVRHPEQIDHLAWSPDGRYLASTSRGDRQTTCVWQIEGWRLLRTVPAASYAVAWSADSQDLAVQGEGGSLRFFTILDGKEVRSIRDAGPVWRMDRAPDGKTLAAIRRGGSAVLRWDAAGKPLPPLPGEAAGFYALARAPDGSRLAAGGGDRTVRIWDAAGKLLHTCNTSDTVNAVAWSPDSTLVASVGSATEIWQAADGKKSATIPIGGQTLAWATDGNRLAVGNQEGTITLFDRTGKTEHTLRGHQTVPTRATLSPDGKRLALTYWLPKIWDEDRRTLIACGDLPGHAYAWSPDGNTLAMSREKDTVLLDGKTGEETAVLERGKPHGSLAWSSDGTSLAICGNDNSLRVWDVRARRSLLDVAGIPKHAAPRQVVAWTPDGRTVSYASGSHVLTCVEVATGRTRTTEGADVDLVTAAAPAPDGKAVAVGYVHGAIRLHDSSLKRIEEVKTGVRVEGLVWLPGGRQVACVLANDTVRVWDLANGTLGKETPRFAWSGPVSGYLITSDCRGGLVCWDVSTGRRQGALLILDNSRVVVLGPEGHWHSDGVAVEMHLVYVVATEKGQELLTPPEFARRFGFQNDPGKARLLPR